MSYVSERVKPWERFNMRVTWEKILRKNADEVAEKPLDVEVAEKWADAKVAEKALAELEEEGRVSALEALEANRDIVEHFIGQRWIAIGHAVTAEGATWQQVGDALGISRQAAHKSYMTTIERQKELAARYDDDSYAEELAAQKRAASGQSV